MQGFRLSDRFYTPLPLAADGTLLSDELGLILRPENEMLRLVDPATGQSIPTINEALAQAQVEARRADQAEAELARLRAELALLRSQTPKE
ncbi:hypothetical protein [Candidatus Amarolinea aalborgensis]|uniref:hypothetical protein n=1 Tax=Candidatus Amarolinea aalborgensis TaxID=2249329 RepID=UPI003BFA2EE9